MRFGISLELRFALLYSMLIIFYPYFVSVLYSYSLFCIGPFSIPYLYFYGVLLRPSVLQVLFMPYPGRIFDNIGGVDFVGRDARAFYCCLSRGGEATCSPLSRSAYYFFTARGRPAPSPAVPESLNPSPTYRLSAHPPKRAMFRFFDHF